MILFVHDTIYSSNKSFMRVPSPNISVKRKGPPPPAPAKKHPQVRALYDYDAQDAEELSLAAGDLLDLLQEEASGWWVGQLRGKKGLFPYNYVEKL